MATHAAEQVHRVFARAMLDRARGSVKRSGMRAQDRRVISAVEDILAHLEQYALWFDRAYEAWCIGASPEAEHMQVASRAAVGDGRAQLRALTLGGAVWDAFRENANCGDLDQTEPLYYRRIPTIFAGLSHGLYLDRARG